MAAINVIELFQRVAEAVDLHTAKTDAFAKTKLAFETAQSEQDAAAKEVESLRKQVHEVLGQVQTRVR